MFYQQYVFGLFRLNPSREPYILRCLNGIFQVYMTRYQPNHSHPFTVTASFFTLILRFKRNEIWSQNYFYEWLEPHSVSTISILSFISYSRLDPVITSIIELINILIHSRHVDSLAWIYLEMNEWNQSINSIWMEYYYLPFF